MKASAAGYRAELGLGFIAIAGFAGAAILGMKNVIDAAMKEEQVQARLNAAIHSTGHAINSAKLEELARDLARITPFAKSDTEGIMALQVQMGLSEDQVLKLTPALEDMTATMKKNGVEGASLENTTRMIAVSVLKGIPPMARTGIVIDKVTWSAMTLDERIKLLADRFRGNAKALGETPAGQMQIFDNEVEELKVNIGEGLIPAFITLLKVATPLVTTLADLAKTPVGRWATESAVGLLFLGTVMTGVGMAAPGFLRGLGLLSGGRLGAGLLARIGGGASRPLPASLLERHSLLPPLRPPLPRRMEWLLPLPPPSRPPLPPPLRSALESASPQAFGPAWAASLE